MSPLLRAAVNDGERQWNVLVGSSGASRLVGLTRRLLLECLQPLFQCRQTSLGAGEQFGLGVEALAADQFQAIEIGAQHGAEVVFQLGLEATQTRRQHSAETGGNFFESAGVDHRGGQVERQNSRKAKNISSVGGSAAINNPPAPTVWFGNSGFRIAMPAGFGALAITVRPPPVIAPATTKYLN